jgi:folylpolyglutamate synthase
MIDIRERIRINGEPISQELFTTRFFEIWDLLPDRATPILDIPRYLQLLALLSFHVFIKEKVEVAIYETHFGGEYDATNIVRKPFVAAITPIAMDHVKLLGPTIRDIAWHKAGIFKEGSLAFSSHQEHAVATVLQERAIEKSVLLEFIDVDSLLSKNEMELKPNAQRTNCALALAVVRAWLSKRGQMTITGENIIRGIKKFSWPGRYQKIYHRNSQWFLDGAHNELSLQIAVDWFADVARQNEKYIIICMVSIIH